VTEEGKNVYAEDVEAAFQGLPVKEFCVFAANYIWPSRSMVGEKLVLVVHLDGEQVAGEQGLTEELRADISARNNKLINYKRVDGVVLYREDFPLNASMKLVRPQLARRLSKMERATTILPL
jgi:long-chain acyl-CoA synthetase